MEELQAAYDKGGNSVTSELDTLQTSMTRAVTAMAPGFDLELAYTTISTISQAAAVEASMNFAKETSRFTA